MPDIHITYEETYEYLHKEWLETRDFTLNPDMRQWQSHVDYTNERIKHQLGVLKELTDKSIPIGGITKVEKCIMTIHNQLGKLYEIRIDTLEGIE